VTRTIEWFWGGAAMAALRASRRVPSASTRELGRRARAAIELGRYALEPPQPSEHAPLEALACDLGAQGAYWALRARRSLDEQAAPGGDETRGARHEDLSALLVQADPEVVARAAGGSEAAERLGSATAGKTFADYAELPPPEQARLARELLPFAEALCDELDTARADVERLWIRRTWRLGLAAVAVAALGWGATAGADKLEDARDLAKGKPWVASSRFPSLGCTSPAQVCPNSEIYFFATVEQNDPSIEFDLGKPEKVSALRVFNRLDCCTDRAVPLVIETSLDHKTWKQVARHDEIFKVWKATFPTVQARWVKLHVPRKSLLHFTRVRILP
jgi:hypothetical protein